MHGQAAVMKFAAQEQILFFLKIQSNNVGHKDLQSGSLVSAAFCAL